VTNNESIYAAPLLYNRRTNENDATLIDILSMNGQVLRSFGVPLDVASPWLNQVVLSIGSGNEVVSTKGKVKQFDEDFKTAFINYLLNKGLTNPTIGKHIKTLKTFMKYCLNKGLTENNEFPKI
jgi:hypothetical protein